VEKVLHLVWDGKAQRPTLGGAIVLRQEGELRARAMGAQALRLHWNFAALTAAQPEAAAFTTAVFGSSALPCEFTEAPFPADAWPSEAQRRADGFSYFSLDRVLAWHERTKEPPRLIWNEAYRKAAGRARQGYGEQLVCLHVKHVAPYHAKDSNAVPEEWQEFLRTRADPGKLDFVLLGEDLPPGLLEIPGVTRAAGAGLDLATQLCFVSHADAFIGMASGLCMAATFSTVPHVIFKHPVHHSTEMKRELAGRDFFSFAAPRQKLWQREATTAALHEALDLALS
jgi:hypothetical protein